MKYDKECLSDSALQKFFVKSYFSRIEGCPVWKAQSMMDYIKKSIVVSEKLAQTALIDERSINNLVVALIRARSNGNDLNGLLGKDFSVVGDIEYFKERIRLAFEILQERWDFCSTMKPEFGDSRDYIDFTDVDGEKNSINRRFVNYICIETDKMFAPRIRQRTSDSDKTIYAYCFCTGQPYFEFSKCKEDVKVSSELISNQTLMDYIHKCFRKIINFEEKQIKEKDPLQLLENKANQQKLAQDGEDLKVMAVIKKVLETWSNAELNQFFKADKFKVLYLLVSKQLGFSYTLGNFIDNQFDKEDRLDIAHIQKLCDEYCLSTFWEQRDR